MYVNFSPSKLCELWIICSNSSSPETDALVKVDQAINLHKFESIIMMSPFPKLAPASEWHVTHLAKPRSAYKVLPTIKWYEIKTAEVEFSSSLCLTKVSKTPVPEVQEVSTPGGHNPAWRYFRSTPSESPIARVTQPALQPAHAAQNYRSSQ